MTRPRDPVVGGCHPPRFYVLIAGSAGVHRNVDEAGRGRFGLRGRVRFGCCTVKLMSALAALAAQSNLTVHFWEESNLSTAQESVIWHTYPDLAIYWIRHANPCHRE